jgi:MFS transporter, FSR family, fosmidomycin resistance protein
MLTVIACAHFIVDGYSNIYPPLLPLLIPRLGLSLAAAGTLAMCFQLAASVSQLAFGRLADRWDARALVVFGPLLSVAVLSLVGIAQSAVMLAVILIVGGLGCAAFHPPATMLAHRVSGPRPGFSMSVYITGGMLGFAVAPLAFASFAQRFGLDWTPVLAIPGVVVLAFLLRGVPTMPVERHGSAGSFRALRPYAGPLALLYSIVVLRTLAALSFATFVPVMLTRRGASVSEAGAVIAVYLFASGLGGFFGGPAADRFGARRVIAWSLLMAAPLLAAAPLLSGWNFLVVFALGGFFLQSTLPVNVMFAHMIAPVSVATVSSLMMGFAWGTGGLAVPFVGILADRIGIESALMLGATMPVLGAACAWPLPSGMRPHVRARPSAVGLPESG